MALQGTLDTFALPDVLRLLAATKKSGRLEISGPGGAGRVWVADGEVTATVVDHAPNATEPTEAIFELLRFESGSFSFDAESAPNGDHGTDVELLLEGAEALLAEWREIEAVVPSLSTWVAMRPELVGDAVSIDRAAWTTLVAVGSGATVATVGEALGMGELPVSRAVRDLVELGVVDLEERAEATPPADHASAPVEDAPTADLDDATVADDDRPVVADDAHDPVPADEDAPAGGEEPASGSIPGPKARRARPKQLRVSEVSAPEVFVPLDLSALQQTRTYDAEPSAEPEPEGDDDLTAAFPGLAAQATTDGTEEAAPPAEDGDVDEHDEPLNRGLLLKFLSSVKS